MRFSNIQLRILKYNWHFLKLNWDFWNIIVIFLLFTWYLDNSQIQLWFSEINLIFSEIKLENVHFDNFLLKHAENMKKSEGEKQSSVVVNVLKFVRKICINKSQLIFSYQPQTQYLKTILPTLYRILEKVFTFSTNFLYINSPKNENLPIS